MNAVPTPVVLSVVVFVALMTAGRWVLVDETATDRLINRTFSWNLLGLLLYEVTVAVGRPEFGPRLYLGCGLLALGSFYGLARLVDGADAATVHLRQRRYDATAVAAVVSLIVATPILRWAWQLDYVEIVWTMSALPGGLCGLLFARACVRELRARGVSIREKLTFAVLLAFATYWLISMTIMVGRALTGTPPSQPGKVWAVAAVLTFSAVTLLTMIPLVTALLARTGLDRTGRDCRRLRPLWRDLTAVVPEVVLAEDGSAPREATSRLYRMTVEIWDALLHLRPYVPALSEAGSPADRHDARRSALQVALAVRAKRDGDTPTPGSMAAGAAHGEARDRAAEFRFLLELARVWPEAVAAVGYRSDTARFSTIAAVSR
ncbi:MAB_1171c family putative transporter [Nocardia sp. NPDC051929]|uniref:MAB_1171c family putative transporter n=1 Tax=Nocardia sp. NPDC051929 TaxID=3364327 RepID=UPI0037CA81EE